MDFQNETKVEAGWTLGFQKDGREVLVVVAKATYAIPMAGDEPQLTEEQVPLVEADEFAGDPAKTAPLYEADFAHRKMECDVLMNGTAYAPQGRPAATVMVGLKVGRVKKGFNVVGQRNWQARGATFLPSRPREFVQLPISYDNAYGGVDETHEEPVKEATFLRNPVGTGYHSNIKREFVDGAPLPNTEELNRPVTGPKGDFAPMAFGPLGRNWKPRFELAGTYDEKWVNERLPFFPDDFDDQYFQAAPPDQRMPYPVGGEEVFLKNLGPEPLMRFTLPRRRMPILFIPHKGADTEHEAVVDTIVIEPDLGRFTMTWRTSLPLRKNCFDFKQVIAGEMPRTWYRARRIGNKPYYKGLDALIRAKNRLPPR